MTIPRDQVPAALLEFIRSSWTCRVDEWDVSGGVELEENVV